MGLKKYRFDREDTAAPNGSIAVYTEWMGGPSLAGVKNCPCPDGVRRMVYVQGEPDTFFSQPAATSVNGKRIKGYLTGAEGGGFEFRPDNARARLAFGLPLLEGETAPA